MKVYFFLVILFLSAASIHAQQTENYKAGTISYLSSQHVYVKFETTRGISPGDTLYVKKDKAIVPAMLVENLSSTSAVCIVLENYKPVAGNQVYAAKAMPEKDEPLSEIKKEELKPVQEEDTLSIKNELSAKEKTNRQKVYGSLAATSYSNFSGISSSTRLRYMFSLDAKHLGNSKLSLESYVSFQHQAEDFSPVQENIFNGLKIYRFALNYDLDTKTRFTFGRRTNPKISLIGAIDGIQFERNLAGLFYGAFAGFRPDYTNYGFDFKLPQFGAFVGHRYTVNKGYMQNSLAFVQQMNRSRTDRRIAILQHSNTLLKNIYFFGSTEIELYRNINDTAQFTFKPVNSYLVLNYRFKNRLYLSASYDNRRNLIFYESYKTYLQQLLEIEARQGLGLQLNYNVWKDISAGIRTGYRFANKNSGETLNMHAFVSYREIPGALVNLTASATYLETAYVIGKIANLNVSRYFLQNNLMMDLTYQYVDYEYPGREATNRQHILNFGIFLALIKRISFSASYEYTFDLSDPYGRLVLQLRKKF